VFLTYRTQASNFNAFLVAFVFDVAWVVITIGLPMLWEFVMWFVAVLIVGVLTVVFYITFGGGEILDAVISFIAAVILLGLIVQLPTVFIYALPGILAASAVFDFTQSEIASLVFFILVEIILVLIGELVFDLFIPFAYGFSWSWVSVVIANYIVLAALFHVNVLQLINTSSGSVLPITIAISFDSFNSVLQTLILVMVDIAALIRSLFNLPFILGMWALVLSVITGGLRVVVEREEN
jgi:hypothetical protein